MLEAAIATVMSCIAGIVWRVRDYDVCAHACHQFYKRNAIQQIPASDTMLAANPYVARSADRLQWHGIDWRIGLDLKITKYIDLARRKPGKLQVETAQFDLGHF